jgi:hypothetical protein
MVAEATSPKRRRGADQSHKPSGANKTRPGRCRLGTRFKSLRILRFSLAVAAADRRVVERDVAGAARLAASREAIAAGLDHFAAGLVAGDAADAAAVLGVFALANTTGQVALANADAVAGAVAAAEAIAEHAAEILQCAAGNFILALAVNLEAAGALFELDLATG